MEKGGLGMPSFTLCPAGADRSRIRCHLPGWLLFGITPKQLICKLGNGGLEKGPAIRPRDTSVFKYSSMMEGCSREDRMLEEADFKEPEGAAKPTWKPNCTPERT